MDSLYYPFSDLNRCTKTGRKCGGYVPAKPAFEVRVFSQPSTSISFLKTLSTLPGSSEHVHYLEFYHYCASPTLSNQFDSEFWSRICLQMAHSEPAVRHALIALGCLNKHQTGSLKNARQGFANEKQQKTLFLHYNKSIRHLVHRMAESSYSAEIGLVSCVLFMCIEFLRADSHAAFVHLRNGLKIIAQLRRRCGTALLREDTEANQSGSTSSPDMIEGKIVPMFIRGMASALLYGMPVEDDFPIPSPSFHSLQTRPFNSILEAQSVYHDFRNTAIVFTRRMAFKLIRGLPVTAEDLACQKEILKCHREWYRALQQHLESVLDLSSHDKVILSLLKASYHSTYIISACATDVGEITYDVHLSGFKELICHVRIVLDSMELGENWAKRSHRAAAANFTFDVSIIPPLYFTACRCRCPVTRRKALSLLKVNPPREGLYDAEQHAIVCSRMIEIEESEVDGRGWPTWKTRLWNTVIDVDIDEAGGFWVHFLPARFVGVVDGNGRQKLKSERLVLGETTTFRPGTSHDIDLPELSTGLNQADAIHRHWQNLRD